jgi:hypothetical protein
MKSMTCCDERQSQIPVKNGNKKLSERADPTSKRLTVTGENQELLLTVNTVYLDIGVGGDNLLLRLKPVVLLKLEISDGSGQCQVTYEGKVTSG